MSVGDVGDGDAGVARGPRPCRPLEIRSQPSSCRRRAKLDDAGLVVDGEQGPHRRHFLLRIEGSARTARMVGVEAALDVLDALVERVDGRRRRGRARPPGRGSGRRRPRAVATWTVQPVTFTPEASASAHRVPALERRQQGRDGCSGCDARRRRGWAWRRRSRSPAIATRSIVARPEHVDDLAACTRRGRSRRRSSSARRASAGTPCGLGDVGGARGAVDHHQRHGDAVGEDGLEQGAAARSEDGDAHWREGTSRPSGVRQPSDGLR